MIALLVLQTILAATIVVLLLAWSRERAAHDEDRRKLHTLWRHHVAEMDAEYERFLREFYGTSA